MKNQTNNEMVPNIEVNDARPKKKKGKVFVIIAIVVVLLISCGIMLGGDDSSTTTVNTEEAKSESTEDKEELNEVETEVTEEPEETEQESWIETDGDETESIIPNGNYYHVGDLISYNGGAEVTIGNVGIVQNQLYYMVLYMETEIENASDETFILGNDNFTLYIDDYQIETTYTALNMNDSIPTYSVSVNPGRKGRYTFRTVIPDDYDNSSKIEIGFPGTTQTLLVKDDGVYLYGQSEVPAGNTEAGTGSGLDESMYGDHVGIDNSELVLNLEPDSWADAVVTIETDYAHQWLLFMENERYGYLTYMEGDDKVGSIYFGMDGIEFENNDFSELNGLYW